MLALDKLIVLGRSLVFVLLNIILANMNANDIKEIERVLQIVLPDDYKQIWQDDKAS